MRFSRRFRLHNSNYNNDNKGADTPYAILSPEWNALGLAEQVKQEAEFHEMIGTGRGGKFKEISDARNAGDTDRFYEIVIAFDKAWMAEQEAWEEFRKEQAEKGEETPDGPEDEPEGGETEEPAE